MNLTHTLFSLAACALLVAPVAGAQEVLSLEGDEIVRDAIELQDLLTPPPDRDSVDTAVVFANDVNRPAHVGCAGYDSNGRVVGHAWLQVLGRGLRFVRASDLSAGQDFISSEADDESPRPVRLRVKIIDFPVVATY